MHLTIENFLEFTDPSYQVMRHFLALSVAAFLAGLVYFIASSSSLSPKYRIISFISGAIMVSAAFSMYQIYNLLADAFTFRPEQSRWVRESGSVFANGNRYVNWSITVPLLLTQILVVLGLAKDEFWRQWRKLIIASLLMIWTGYIGQFNEAYRVAPGVDAVPFWLWGGISTVFYVYLYFVLARSIGEATLSERVREHVRLAWWITVFSWMLYPIAYVIPALFPTSEAVAARQVVYSIADISSKVVFGIVLSRIALIRSAEDGHGAAVEAMAGGRPVAR